MCPEELHSTEYAIRLNKICFITVLLSTDVPRVVSKQLHNSTQEYDRNAGRKDLWRLPVQLPPEDSYLQRKTGQP